MSLITRCVSSLQICRWKLSDSFIRSKCLNVQLSRDIHLLSRAVVTPSPLLRHFSVSSSLHTLKPSIETEKKTIESKETKAKEDEGSANAPTAKPSVFQQLKQMSKDYWYVLIPVHLITSAGWFGGFYFAVKSGLDVVALLENLGVSEKIINPLRGSSAGYVALAYAMYKVATPARYTVTLGGTTASIKYLTSMGYIKPVPSKEKLQMMLDVRKQKFNKQRDAFRRKLRHHRAEIKKKMQSRKPVRK